MLVVTSLLAEDDQLSDESSLEDGDNLSDADSEMSDFDKDFYDDADDALDDAIDMPKPKTSRLIEETGLKEHSLYRCGNINCDFSASTAAEFKDHIPGCEHSDPLHHFSCYHCHSEHNHLQSLLEHLKTHSLKRYLCSLCDFRDPLMTNMKTHVKTVHKLFNFKFVPIESNKTNPEKDFFMVVPKHNLLKTGRAKSIKDTFSPSDISSIPKKPDIYKYVLKCSLCDFGTRVKNNLVKHLKLHLKHDTVPVLAPVNPPPVDEGETSALSRMTSLLPDDIDEEMKRKVLTFEELAQLPALVPENMR